MLLAVARNAPPSPLAIACIVAGFIAYFFFVLWLVGWMTGWRKIAAQFPPPAAALDGDVFTWRSLRMWFIGGYNNCIRATICDGGVLVAVQRPFSLGHPPIFFPWSAVEPLREKSLLGFRYHVLPLKTGERTIELHLPAKAREAVDRRRSAVS